MSIRGSQVAALTLVGALLALSGQSNAESGFALNRFDAADAGGRWLSSDSLHIEGHLRPSFGVVSDWANKPLVVYSGNGDSEQVAVAQNQMHLHAQASLSLVDKVRIGVSVPFMTYHSGSAVVLPDQESFSTGEQTSFGDIRLSADVRLYGHHNSPLTLAIGGALYLPTGSPAQLSGDGTVRMRPRLQIAGQKEILIYAARTGAHIRTADSDFLGEKIASEAFLGGSIGALLLDRKLLAGITVNAATELGSDAFTSNGLPFEMQLTAQYQVTPQWHVGAGVGSGFGQGIGVPSSRFLLSAGWSPATTPAARLTPEAATSEAFLTAP